MTEWEDAINPHDLVTDKFLSPGEWAFAIEKSPDVVHSD